MLRKDKMSFTAAAGFTATQRNFMFHLICIPIRLSLSAFVYNFGENTLTRSAAVVSGLVAYFTNSKKIRETPPDKVWWYRSVHMITGLSIAILFIMSPRTTVPSLILLADAMFGLATSFFAKSFGSVN